MKLLMILLGFGVAVAIAMVDGMRLVVIPWPILVVALIVSFVVGYYGFLSVALQCKIADVYTRQKGLAGFRQTLVNAGLLALLALAAMITVLSYMRHHGVTE